MNDDKMQGLRKLAEWAEERAGELVRECPARAGELVEAARADGLAWGLRMALRMLEA